MLGLVISLGGVLHFLLVLAIVVLVIVLFKALMSALGVPIPREVWIVLGIIIVIIFLIWMIGGAGVVEFR